jgi:hypothetical protein
MMKRGKGATLAEITEATGWQKHTVRGFVSILGRKVRPSGFLFFVAIYASYTRTGQFTFVLYQTEHVP